MIGRGLKTVFPFDIVLSFNFSIIKGESSKESLSELEESEDELVTINNIILYVILLIVLLDFLDTLFGYLYFFF